MNKKDESDSVTVEPGFIKQKQTSDNNFVNKDKKSILSDEDKSNRLKKRLNIAILIVVLLLICVFVLLFKF